jgi:hypothetical protein
MTSVEIALIANLLGTLAGSIAYCLDQSRRVSRLRE